MIEKEYQKACNAKLLTREIVAAGLPQHPNAGARFYGVTVEGSTTKVLYYSDLTAGELTTIDGVVTAHTNTALQWYRIRCTTESVWYSVRVASAPTACPIDGAHGVGSVIQQRPYRHGLRSPDGTRWCSFMANNGIVIRAKKA
jgi:hypothetical protein